MTFFKRVYNIIQKVFSQVFIYR